MLNEDPDRTDAAGMQSSSVRDVQGQSIRPKAYGPKNVSVSHMLNTVSQSLKPNNYAMFSFVSSGSAVLDEDVEVGQLIDSGSPALSYVTASNSRHNPVERIAILIFGSDLGARFDSKLEDFAVLGPNTALLWANSRPEICS